MIMESEVREKLIAFLRNEISLRDFEDWLVSESWNMHLDSSREAQELVSAIELALAEYSSGHQTYSEVRNEFISLLDNVVVSVQISVQRVFPVRLSGFTARAFQPPALLVQL